MISVVVVCKDEPAVVDTLRDVIVATGDTDYQTELIVVDASSGRLEHVRRQFPGARWLDYQVPADSQFTIAHQRNLGVEASRGDIVVFVDAGCRPDAHWLPSLVEPLLTAGESLSAGLAMAPEGRAALYDADNVVRSRQTHLTEAATINLAVRRSVFDLIGVFDETFEYGSDIDFSWRAVDAGLRIRSCPQSVVRHDWGDWRRQVRRAFRYGRGRVRLYRKHPHRLASAWRSDPIVFAYPLFLLGLPLVVAFPLYPALLLVPFWRARRSQPTMVLADHLAYGCGVLRELVGP